MGFSKTEFSDTIAGYVTSFCDGDNCFTMQTSVGEEYTVEFGDNLYGRVLRNLDEPYYDCTPQIPNLLKEGVLIFVYGIFYPEKGEHVFEAQMIDFLGKRKGNCRFEERDWWINQADSIASFYINNQFQDDEINYRDYKTHLKLSGAQTENFRQETDTISRLVYGFSSAFMLTGKDIYLEAAEKGTQYLRDHMRFYDMDENLVYWYHGIEVEGDRERKIFASEFGDDFDAIPAYEQIYALAGPTQTYRANGDPAIMKDIRMTIDLFDKFFHDPEKEGYFSHIDPITLDPRSDSLGANKARKNWNSIGDHAPAYLINLYLATGEEKYKEFLEYTADCIVKYFPDYENSPFVQERFFEDWTPDKEWGWQQDRAVVGHNLKIAWNLMRINNLIPKDKYVELAEKIAELMPQVGMDTQRCGFYDVMERTLDEGEEFYRFAWHDRKAWWQQEQGILAYMILNGILGKDKYQKLAKESAAFYNNYFLDHDDGAIYFNVLNNGIPYLMGQERKKGSHSMSGYHSIELAYLASVYTNLLNTKKPLELYFKPFTNAFPDNKLRVEPDLLPEDSVKISDVWIDGRSWDKYDAKNLIVDLPNLTTRPKIKVKLEPLE